MNIEKKFNKILLAEMGFSIIYLILGVIIFLNSEIASNVTGILVGIFFFIAGCLQIYTYIDKSKIKFFRYNLWTGILEILVSLLIMINPFTFINILNISLGIWLVIEALCKLIVFYQLRKVNEESNRIFLMSTLLLLFMGIILIINPFRTILITKTIGIFIILYNVVNLNNLVLLKRRSKKFIKLFK